MPSVPPRQENAEPLTYVKRRHVFYVPGFDPIHPRRYRELYRREGAQQAEISGYALSMPKKRLRASKFGWSVDGIFEGKEVQTEVTVLMWSEIVKSSMGHGILATYWQLLVTAWIYFSTGAIRRVVWLSKGAAVAAFYPIVMLIAQLLVAVLAAVFVSSLVSGLIYPRAGWVLFPPVIILVLRQFKKHDSRILAYYLMHNFAYTAQLKGAYTPQIEEKLAEFTQQIERALAGDYDEVLIVGHSSGVHLAVSALADVLRRRGDRTGGPAIGFLSLGQVVPMLSFLPKAQRLRRDLVTVSEREDIAWVDVSAPSDGCSFALCDPVAVSGVATPRKRWPLVLSAAYTNTLSPEKLLSMKRRYFRLHFQYLCAFDRPGDYDYFQITAGPLTLKERYAHRDPSPSRIDIAVSSYTDT
ncbi:hypothetical protein ACFE33_09015 [Falsihalocynthiibacter sp. SS001]|uniref:hypothetical protein n=1 Tax=Falsihalocynthiibacter sp. SS001 TaxID=3349698 RepID=UPI0036D3F911